MTFQIFAYFCEVFAKTIIMFSEDLDKKRAIKHETDDVFSKPVRAGKRTYFFDVKSTKGNNDYYLTITESKRKVLKDGSYTYDKHKIFLYKEDFEKFQNGLAEAIDHIKEECLPKVTNQTEFEQTHEGNDVPETETDNKSSEEIF